MAGTDTPSRIAVVTGASQGIGRAIAVRLAKDGFVVWAVARRRAALEELRTADIADRIRPAPCDLTEPQAVAELAATIAAETPGLAALIHCAGTIAHGSFAETAPDELTRQFTTNVRGTYLLTQLLLPRLSDNASIVVLNSTQGLRASAGTASFAASMHALRALTDALRDEVNERGIRVTSVYPGRTATPRQEDLYARKGSSYRPELLLQPEDVAALVSTIVQLPATAEVTDIHIRPAIKSY